MPSDPEPVDRSLRCRIDGFEARAVHSADSMPSAVASGIIKKSYVAELFKESTRHCSHDNHTLSDLRRSCRALSSPIPCSSGDGRSVSTGLHRLIDQLHISFIGS